MSGELAVYRFWCLVERETEARGVLNQLGIGEPQVRDITVVSAGNGGSEKVCKDFVGTCHEDQFEALTSALAERGIAGYSRETMVIQLPHGVAFP